MGCGQSTDGQVWAEPTQKVVRYIFNMYFCPQMKIANCNVKSLKLSSFEILVLYDNVVWTLWVEPSGTLTVIE